LYNGLVLLIDDETQTYWDHMSGQGVHGPLRGHELPMWPLIHTTFAAAKVEYPGVHLHRLPVRGPLGLVMRIKQREALSSKGIVPFFFRGTMGQGDERLPETLNGLGVLVDGKARFYPLRSLTKPVDEDWGGRTLRIGLGPIDGAPHATWTDDHSRPMQLLSHWYGFSSTYPGCEIFESPIRAPESRR
jgi:hypothetical protein